jgi:hypothetical protein
MPARKLATATIEISELHGEIHISALFDPPLSSEHDDDVQRAQGLLLEALLRVSARADTDGDGDGW